MELFRAPDTDGAYGAAYAVSLALVAWLQQHVKQ